MKKTTAAFTAAAKGTASAVTTAAKGTASAVTTAAKSTAAAVTGFASKVKDDLTGGGTLPIWILIVIALLLIVCFLVWLKYKGVYETPTNIRDIVSARYETANDIVKAQGQRAGLDKYLRPCEGNNKDCNEDFGTDVPPTVGILSNFYFSTVNATGLFFPEAYSSDSPKEMEYVFSPEAIKFACRGGARAFVLDIWPSMDPQGGFRPILQVIQNGSKWRRISMNTMEFSTAIQTIITEIYTTGILDMGTPKTDICVFYLRFLGVPRDQTYKGVATALTTHAQPYLLDPTFAYGRGMINDRLMNTNIRDLKGKIILACNKTRAELQQAAPTLYPFVNICHENDKKIEYTLSDLENDMNPKSTKEYIKSSLTFIVPSLFDEKTHTNEWSWNKAYDAGIHCIAMNFFNRKTRSAEVYFGYNDTNDTNATMVPSKFSKYSYKLKDSTLFKKVVTVPEPPVATDSGIGDGNLNSASAIDVTKVLDICVNPYNELVRLYTEVLSQDNLGAYSGRVRYEQRPEIQNIRKLYDDMISPEKNQFEANNCKQDTSRADEIRKLERELKSKIAELLG